jgi:hypothetical protein
MADDGAVDDGNAMDVDTAAAADHSELLSPDKESGQDQSKIKKRCALCKCASSTTSKEPIRRAALVRRLPPQSLLTRARLVARLIAFDLLP